VTLSIRQRLTLWYTSAVAILLAVLAISLLLVHDRLARAGLETDLRRINDAVATVLANELIEKGHAHAAAEEALIEVVVPGRHLAIATRDGRVLAQRWTLPSAPPLLDVAGARERTTTLITPVAATIITRALPPVPEGFVVVTAATWNELYRDRSDLVRTLLVVMPIALIVTMLGAFWVAGRALRPARRMAAEARRLSERAPGQRLTTGRQDELGQLATAFNGLVDRLESALAVRSRFLADASHELRTPVSIARTAADVALSREGRSDAEYRDALAVISRQMTHLGRIVSDMLALARSDATDWPLTITDFYFEELLAEAVRAMAALATAREVTVQSASPVDLQIRGDEGLLYQMIVNLLENAIRHTPPGGAVRVTVTTPSGEIRITVEDTGHGIEDPDRERIFDRFVQASSSAEEANHTRGTGLGLAIARRIARAHQGDVTLASTGPTGSCFVATLPRPSAAPTADRARAAVPRSA
jgi:heavy metal sensor kinase